MNEPGPSVWNRFSSGFSVFDHFFSRVCQDACVARLLNQADLRNFFSLSYLDNKTGFFCRQGPHHQKDLTLKWLWGTLEPLEIFGHWNYEHTSLFRWIRARPLLIGYKVCDGLITKVTRTRKQIKLSKRAQLHNSIIVNNNFYAVSFSFFYFLQLPIAIHLLIRSLLITFTFMTINEC